MGYSARRSTRLFGSKVTPWLEGRRGIAAWIEFYNERRVHQALGYRAPRAVWCETMVGRNNRDHVDNAFALPRVGSCLHLAIRYGWSASLRALDDAVSLDGLLSRAGAPVTSCPPPTFQPAPAVGSLGRLHLYPSLSHGP